ncbi:MAG: phosphatase PAP2 family protein [Alphaproteobacteria bacterium]
MPWAVARSDRRRQLMLETLRRFDEWILLALRDPADPADPIGPVWLEIAMADLTALGSHAVLLLATLLTLVYFAIERRPRSAFLVIVSIGGAILLATLLKEGFDRARPGLVAHLVDTHTASFPSGHAMLSAVAWLTLGTLLAGAQESRALKVFFVAAAIALTLIVGFSRIYLGVHWPSDVVGGWLIGAMWATLCRRAVLRMRREQGAASRSRG